MPYPVWIPPPSQAVMLLKRLRERGALLADAADLFWTFFSRSHPTEEDYWHRLELFGEIHSRGGKFVDADAADIMYLAWQDPAGSVQRVADLLDEVLSEFTPGYVPDHQDDPLELVIGVYVRATHFLRMRRLQGDSEAAQDSLAALDRLLARLEQVASGLHGPWLDLHTSSLLTIRSLVRYAQYEAASTGVDPELNLGLAYESMIDVSFANDAAHGRQEPIQSSSGLRVDTPWSHSGWFSQYGLTTTAGPARRWVPYWLQEFAAQRLVDQFESLRLRSLDTNWPELSEMCLEIPELWVELGKANDELVRDADGTEWPFFQFWSRASGFAAAQADPSDVSRLIDRARDADATHRLTTYFFPGGLWERLPEKTREALVSADSLFTSDAPARKERALDDVRRAFEALLYERIWSRLCELPQADQPVKLRELQAELTERHQEFPGLVQYSALVSHAQSTAAMTALGLQRDSIDFLRKELVPFLRTLRGVRGPAMHDPRGRPREDSAADLLAQAMGMGAPGILPRAALALEPKETTPELRKEEER